MNTLEDEELFVNEHQNESLVVSHESENILEHTLSAIRSSYNENKNLQGEEDVLIEEENFFWDWARKPNIYLLYVFVAFKVLAENMVLSIILDQTLRKISLRVEDPIDVQQEYTLFQSYTSIIQSLSGFVLCSYYANLSDTHGRVHVLKICGWWTLLGSLANIYLYCFNSIDYQRWLFITLYCIEGMNGGVLSLTAIGSSYIFDIASKTERFVKLSIFMSIIYGAIGLGPLIGSFLVAKRILSNAGMIYLAFIVNALYSLGCFFVLAESRKEKDRRESQTIYLVKQQERINKTKKLNWKEKVLYQLNYAEQLVSLFKPLQTLWVPKTHRGSLIPRFNVLILIFIEVFVNGFIEGCVPAVIAFSMFQFDWNSVEIGWFYSLSGIVRCIVLLLIVPNILHFLQKKFTVLNDSIDKIDKIYLNFFLIFSVLGFLSIIVLPNTGGVYCNAFFLSLTAFAIPTIQNVIIKYSSKKNTSVVFAGIAILRNLVQLVTPPILLKVYSMTLLKEPLTFLYIPLVFSVFSIFLLKLVRIVEDKDLLRRESMVVDARESLLNIQEDPETILSPNYNSIQKPQIKSPDFAIPITKTKAANINTFSVDKLSSSFTSKRREIYNHVSGHETASSVKSQSYLSASLFSTADGTGKQDAS